MTFCRTCRITPCQCPPKAAARKNAYTSENKVSPMGDFSALGECVFTIPVKTESEANRRDHWAAKRRRRKRQQAETVLAMRQAFVPMATPLLIVMTRIAPKRYPRALDSDNLAGSFKHVQDAIAAEIGIDDGDARLTWKYEQAVGDDGPCVRVRIETTQPAVCGTEAKEAREGEPDCRSTVARPGDTHGRAGASDRQHNSRATFAQTTTGRRSPQRRSQ